MSIIETKFCVQQGNRIYKHPVTYAYEGSRIVFLKSSFGMKDDIKAMQGARWHGFEKPPRKVWSVANSARNRFQLEYLEGGNPYEWFDRDLIQHDYPKFGNPGSGYFNLMRQQRLMADTALTYHYQVWAAEMGTGKTLAAIATMLLSETHGWWWWVPKSSLYNIRKEFQAWGLPEGVVDQMLSYEGMVKAMTEWRSGDPAPIGVVFDESHNLKTASAKRTQAAMKLTEAIRDEHGHDGFAIVMTGTPAPKSPVDWWAPCEIAYPGFLREGSDKSFRERLAFQELQEIGGQSFNSHISWRDDEMRCAECGYYAHDEVHDRVDGDHLWRRSENEVAALYERLEGLVTIVHKKDCLELPDKIYKTIICEPKPSLLRVAQAIRNSSERVITSLVLLRELSDGFQYRDVEDGYKDCPVCTDGTELRHYHPDDPGATISEIELLSPEFVESLQTEEVPCECCDGTMQVVKTKRITREVPCPKEEAIVDLLDQNDAQGRIVIFAGFTGSLDRIVRIAQKNGWNTLRLDGRGWDCQELTGEPADDLSPGTRKVKLDNPLDFWTDPENKRVAFIAHPKSGGVSLTLSPRGEIPGATMTVFYSNDFNPAARAQAEDRIHRVGMDENKGATIVDLIHLPTDSKVIKVLRENRKLELMTMGEFDEVEDD